MDDTICHYTTAYNNLKKMHNDRPYPQSARYFYIELVAIKDAIESVNILRESNEVYILTAPSYMNELSYTEKRIWIEEHFDIEFCKNLIFSYDKSLLCGDILIDDNIAGNGQENFNGKLIQYGSNEYPNWKTIINTLL